MCQYITDTAMKMSANLFKLQAKSEFEFLADKSDKVSKLISGTRGHHCKIQQRRHHP